MSHIVVLTSYGKCYSLDLLVISLYEMPEQYHIGNVSAQFIFRFPQDSSYFFLYKVHLNAILTLTAPITTAADDIHKYFFIVF